MQHAALLEYVLKTKANQKRADPVFSFRGAAKGEGCLAAAPPQTSKTEIKKKKKVL
jgi:hypothetical protein